jgi:hypothetical protein
MTTVKTSRGGWIKRKPAPGAHLKKIWKDPEKRAAQIAAIKEGSVEHQAERKADPMKFTRYGIPNGMTRAQAAPLWEEARCKADWFIYKMMEDGELPEVNFKVPDTDEAKGVAALHEATVLALGPGEKQAKLAAIRTVLEWTKAKPATRSKIDVTTSEDWLAEIASGSE